MQAVELSWKNGFGPEGHDGVIVQNNPINYFDNLGLSPNDCDIMKSQEKASQGMKWAFWSRGRVCGQALITCQQNCNTAEIDETSCGRDWDKDKCMKECKEAAEKCNRGEDFKHPKMLKDKFCGK